MIKQIYPRKPIFRLQFIKKLIIEFTRAVESISGEACFTAAVAASFRVVADRMITTPAVVILTLVEIYTRPQKEPRLIKPGGLLK